MPLGRVTHGKQVRGGGARRRVAQKTPYDEKNKWFSVSLTRTWVTGAPPWSQAWGWSSVPSAWPGPMGTGPARHSPKRQHGTPFPQTHHQQEGPKGSGAMCAGHRPNAGTLAVRSSAAEASCRDVERHLSGGEGA